jgi:hypothetical protein
VENGDHPDSIRDEYNAHTQRYTCTASDTFATREIPGNQDKLSRMDAAVILYDEALHQKRK